MPLTNCAINLILTWSDDVIISFAIGETKFKITDTKLYIPWTQDNAKLFEQLQSGFKREIKWNKYQSEVSIQVSHPYLDYLLHPKLQRVNRLFIIWKYR